MFSVSYFRTLTQAKQTGEITEFSDEYKAIEDAYAQNLHARLKGMIEIIPVHTTIPAPDAGHYISTT